MTEFSYGFNLFAVQRADDDVAVGSIRLLQGLVHVCPLLHIPCMHVDSDAVLRHTVAGQKQSTVILHHAAAVTVLVVERQHHAHLHFLSLCCGERCGGGSSLCAGRSRRISLSGSIRPHRYVDIVAFLQFIPWHAHLGIGCLELIDGYAILFGNAIACLTFLYFMLSLYLDCLRRQQCDER